MTKRKNIQVSKDEFDKFIRAYPRHLTVNVYGASEPPLITYNDLNYGSQWPDSVVASTFAYDDNEDGRYYKPEDNRYYSILSNYKEVFGDKEK